MNSQEYIEVAINIAPFSEENAEIVTAEISELPFESFSMEDPCLKCYIQKELYDAQALKVVLGGMEGMGFEVGFTANLMPAVNWNAVWESQFTPIVVDGLCTIKASFHEGLKKTRYNITIDPKMAFGTGHHQTTYMMCRALLQNEDAVRDKVVLDMGCGTAILAILAAKMKAAHVYGIDIDAVAAISAYDNARLNRVGKKIETYCGDASLLQRNTYDTILANINRNILLQDMPTYAKCLRRDGRLFVSGFYVEDMPMLIGMAEASGLEYVSHDSIDNWCCITFRNRQ
ncbi:MAG: 50S ribosomal protein L11 methyltransferase [Bacteroidales bacterium]|nr:50S ribosomal protein L11 methyltransferase [Bacteroidales bacterium]